MFKVTFCFFLISSLFLFGETFKYSSGGISGNVDGTGPDAYFHTEGTLKIHEKYQFGYSWYSNVLPIFRTAVPGIQIGLASTWITPNLEDISQGDIQNLARRCDNPEIENCIRNYGKDLWVLFQSMEGSLGYWLHTKFPTAMPKYKLDAWKNFYSYSVSSPGFNVSTRTNTPIPLSKGSLGPVYLSNRILIPPDGLTFPESTSGRFLGFLWLPIPLAQEWRETEEHTWFLFLNAKNFKGPLIYHAEEFWADYSGPENLRQKLGLQVQPAVVRSFASEWNKIPYITSTKKNEVWSKIPPISFPVDSDGRTVLLRDPLAYAKPMGQEVLDKLLSEKSLKAIKQPVDYCTNIPLSASSSKYLQAGKRLELFEGFNLVTFDNQTAFGFQWDDKKKGIQELPSYFKEEGDARLPVQESEVPKELVQSKFKAAGDSNFKFETPAWWFEDAEVDSKEYTADLTDKTTVTYRWVRFKDQPAVKALKLSEEQMEKLQKTVEKIHKSCADGPEFMAPPTKGELAEFDPGLLVKPPEGKEVGWVPLIVRQEIVAR